MTAPLDISFAQIKALARGAKAGGCVVEVEMNGRIYRFKPEPEHTDRPNTVDSNEDFEL